MKNKALIVTAMVAVIIIIALLIALCTSLLQYKTFKNDKIEVMCKGSVNAALHSFEEYGATGREADYISGVASFRTYMTAYLCLSDNESSKTDYIWCNALYGEMIINPDKVKAYIPELVEALEYLAEDYDHPNGFNLINSLTNKLRLEE